jgi:hypothetical protein
MILIYYQIKTKSYNNWIFGYNGCNWEETLSLPQLLITENNKMLQEKIQVL